MRSGKVGGLLHSRSYWCPDYKEASTVAAHLNIYRADTLLPARLDQSQNKFKNRPLRATMGRKDLIRSLGKWFPCTARLPDPTQATNSLYSTIPLIRTWRLLRARPERPARKSKVQTPHDV